MTALIIILIIIIFLLGIALYYVVTKSSDKSEKIIVKETQIKALLLNYNDAKKNIKNIETTLKTLKKSELKSEKDYLSLLDSL